MRIAMLELILGFLFVFVSISQAAVSLSLEPSSKDVAAKSCFTLNMNLSNPGNEQLSFLNFWLFFDPTYLQVIDVDAGNWISDDINVLDGPYHQVFNWDFHGQNIVDNTAGTISYGEGSFDSTVIGDGSFAQVCFLANVPVSNTQVGYLMSGTGGLDDTYVMGIFANNILDSVRGVGVSVTPEPLSVFLYLVGGGILGQVYLKKKKSL